MEKILGLILSATYVFWLFTSQSVQYENQKEITPLIAKHHSINVERSQEQMNKAIKEAGELNTWIMTEFKSNTIIAEKITKNETLSVTVTFDKSSFNVSPENIDLENSIKKALNI